MSINISRTDGKAPQKINHISLRASNEQLEIIEAESRAVNMNRSEYLLYRGTVKDRSLRRLKKERLSQNEYAELTLMRREYIAQGNNLNQIARSVNQANQEGRSIEIDSKALREIAMANQLIAKKIQKLGAKK
ncbi:hypothetical protein [Chamaesiphon sp.]|jgi:uncharacterized protein YnzC (UPF0291/DUF896 family)|uniref:hypothetical protein n=1 Tax=Chamaesiphon sp. TaxID=2814140 RepID=UPI0035948D90